MAGGAERPPDTEFTCAAADRERQHAADADGSNDECQQRERAEQRRVQPAR